MAARLSRAKKGRMMERGLEFINFEPGEELQNYARRRMMDLVEMAPYDASACSAVERNDVTYSCRVEILSRFGTFIAHHFARSPRAAIDQTCRQVENQMHRWQSQNRTGGYSACLA